MSDEPRDEDPIVSWSIPPILREVNAMRLHCESHGVNFQLKLPGRGLPWNL